MRRSRANGARGLTTDLAIIRSLQKVLRQGEWKVTAAVHHRARPGGDRRHHPSGLASTTASYGLAIDIGSTTIAMRISALSTGEVLPRPGATNPQIRFGEDLMSRVSYVMMNPGGDAK